MAPSPSTATFGNVLILSVLIRVLIKADLYYRISGTDVSSNNGMKSDTVTDILKADEAIPVSGASLATGWRHHGSTGTNGAAPSGPVTR